MSKKIILLLAILLSTLTAFSQTVGQWDIYPTFTTKIKYGGMDRINSSKVIATSTKTYFLMGSQLCSVENDNDGETLFYSSKNFLNDNYIDDIYYNYDNKYLLIIYQNSNIDLLYDNGKVVNMAEIRDAILQKGKKINDVAFLPSKNRIFIAASFGLIVYDDKNHNVVESGIYNNELTGITIINNNLIVNMSTTKTVVTETDSLGNPIKTVETPTGVLAYSPVSDRHISQNSFKTIGDTDCPRFALEALSGNKLVALSQPSGNLSIITLDNGMNSFTSETCGSAYRRLLRSKDMVFASKGPSLSTIDKDGKHTLYKYPSSLASDKINTGNMVGFYESPSQLWTVNYNGEIGCYNLSTDGKATAVKEPFVPNAPTARRILGLTVGKDGTVYPYETRLGKYFSKYQEMGQDSTGVVSRYQNGVWKEMYRVSGLTQMREIPTMDNWQIVSSWWGLGVFEDGVRQFGFTKSGDGVTKGQAPFIDNIVTDFGFDKDGNLWVLEMTHYGKDDKYISKLPVDKLGTPKVKNSDWTKYSLWNRTGEQGSRILICKKSQAGIVFSGSYKAPFAVFSLDDPSNQIHISNPVDQDGKSFLPEYNLSMAEDQNGKVWVTSTDGVFEITDPVKFLTTKTINRIKVPRNDGTNFADYLLDGIVVSGVAVDSSNRKWLTTVGSGIYLVNEDGSEILEHFDTSNSEVPTNDFYSVAVDPTSSKVYFGTTEGLVEYIGNSSPAAGDYSDVYAYPNPVRPDYTGWITVTNLMDNSLVKITDAAGFVLYSTTSEGGMVTWDGCNSAGERVKTGVYYVWASQNSDGKSSGVVTKILVVN
ncbi:MAG: hypothetical protein K1V84_02220 [Muribaculaceae bacterium]